MTESSRKATEEYTFKRVRDQEDLVKGEVFQQAFHPPDDTPA